MEGARNFQKGHQVTLLDELQVLQIIKVMETLSITPFLRFPEHKTSSSSFSFSASVLDLQLLCINESSSCLEHQIQDK